MAVQKLTSVNLLLLLVSLFGAALSAPVFHEEKHEMLPSLLPPGDQHDALTDPFQQQRWLSVRPFQEYPRPKSEELGLLLQYLDNKRNVPLLDDESQQAVGGSPLGTMRFGKRAAQSPLGTMRFGKRQQQRQYNSSPLGTMRFGKRQQQRQYNSSPLGTMRFG